MKASDLFSLLPLVSLVSASLSVSDVLSNSVKAFAAKEDIVERSDIAKRDTVSDILTYIEDAAECSSCEVSNPKYNELRYAYLSIPRHFLLF